MTTIKVIDQNDDVLGNVEIDCKKPVLGQLEGQGIEIPNACKMGMCAACMCTIEQGSQHAVKNLRGEPSFPLGEEEIMTCIGGFKETGDTIILRTMS